MYACPGTDRNQPSAVFHPATHGSPLLPESCVRMPRHRPETAERRGSPGDPWEPTSTGILCALASVLAGNCRAPWLIRPPTGTHFYRNPVYACLGTDRKLPSALAHPATHGSPLLPEFCVRTPWHRPEIAERLGSPSQAREPTSTGILCAHALATTGNSRAPRLANHPWNPCSTGIPCARPRCRLESAERRGHRGNPGTGILCTQAWGYRVMARNHNLPESYVRLPTDGAVGATTRACWP